MTRERLDTVGEDGQTTVHDDEGSDAKIAHGERLVSRHLYETDIWHTGILMLYKTVGHVVTDIGSGGGVGVDIDVAEDAERAKVVHTADMVVVMMGDKDGINLAEFQRQHLLTEVWTTVDEQPR